MKLFALLVSLLVILCATSADFLTAIQPSIDPTPIPLSPTGGGTYPRLANVQGAILAAYKIIADGNISTLMISRSTDGGKSFSAWGTVISGTGDIDNPNLIQLPSNGAIICTFRNHDKNDSGDYIYYRITAAISMDGGRNWDILSQVDQRPTANQNDNGLWEPFNRISADNSLQVFYASENSNIDQDILMRTSTNNGMTWSEATTVAGGTTTGRDGMPGCTSYPGNLSKVLCVFETTEGSGTLFTVKSVVSNDDGVSWDERSQVYVPTGSGNNAGAPQVITTSSGALVTSFMTDEDTSLHMWPLHGADFKIITSVASDPPV